MRNNRDSLGDYIGILYNIHVILRSYDEIEKLEVFIPESEPVLSNGKKYLRFHRVNKILKLHLHFRSTCVQAIENCITTYGVIVKPRNSSSNRLFLVFS